MMFTADVMVMVSGGDRRLGRWVVARRAGRGQGLRLLLSLLHIIVTLGWTAGEITQCTHVKRYSTANKTPG